MDTPESDPYKPTRVDELAGSATWIRLASILQSESPPNILLVGGAGIGKSCALRICLNTPKSIIGLWLQCSQDTTLKDNRERIKMIARKRTEHGIINWIILEHADALHIDAQAFLRRIIEKSMVIGSTRFLFEVRDSAAITEPLLSRTILFNVPPLLNYEIRSEIMKRNPSLLIEDAQMFSNTCDGNLRWAILQGLAVTVPGLSGFLGVSREPPPHTWSDVLRIMESIQTSGTNPRTFVNSDSIYWDRPGWLCHWSVVANMLSDAIP